MVCGLSRRQLDSLDSEALEVDELEVEPEDTFVDFLQVEEVIDESGQAPRLLVDRPEVAASRVRVEPIVE